MISYKNNELLTKSSVCQVVFNLTICKDILF